jgi:hypothetical protein
LKRLNGTATRDEVHDDRDDREEQQQVNEEAGDVHDGEAANPKDHENDSENEEHENLLSVDLFAWTSTAWLGERRYKP